MNAENKTFVRFLPLGFLSMAGIFLKKWAIILIVLLFALVLWQLGITAAVFWAIFLTFLVYGWNFRIVVLLALLALLAMVIFMVFNRYEIAEILAVYVYYFLVISLALKFIESRHWQKKPAGDLALEPSPSGPFEKQPLEQRAVEVLAAGMKKINFLPQAFNVFMVVLYLLIFGAELPKPKDYFGFIIFFLVLILINLALFLTRLKAKK